MRVSFVTNLHVVHCMLLNLLFCMTFSSDECAAKNIYVNIHLIIMCIYREQYYINIIILKHIYIYICVYKSYIISVDMPRASPLAAGPPPTH